nr:peptidase S10 [Sphingobium sp. AP50]
MARVRGHMFFTAYRMIGGKARRPVTFLWNGGPGGPSAILHFHSFGPKRLEGGRLVDNPDTLLTSTDLVFVDPIGTGYSRPEREEDEPLFYNTLGDVSWATRFVEAWLDRFDARSSPVYALGESFGVPRVAGIADALSARHVPLEGIILISGGKILIDAALPPARNAALKLPGQAATAFHHGRLAPARGGDIETVRRRSLDWATSVYEPALTRIGLLSDSDRNHLASELAGWAGVDPSLVDRSALTLDMRMFRSGLIKGKTLYAYDMRLIGSGPDRRADASPILRYFADDLGYRTDLAYWGIEPGQPPINAEWKYTGDSAAIADATAGGGPPERQPWISRAIGRDPALRVLVATGHWDSQNSCAANRALRLLGTAMERKAMIVRCYEGGHMIYEDAPVRQKMALDIARFIKAVRR